VCRNIYHESRDLAPWTLKATSRPDASIISVVVSRSTASVISWNKLGGKKTSFYVAHKFGSSDFSLLSNVQNSSGASTLLGNRYRGACPAVKRPRREADHSHPSSAMSRMKAVITLCLRGMEKDLIFFFFFLRLQIKINISRQLLPLFAIFWVDLKPYERKSRTVIFNCHTSSANWQPWHWGR